MSGPLSNEVSVPYSHTHPSPDCVDMDAIQSAPSNILLNLLVAGWFVFIFGDGVWIGNPSWLQTYSFRLLNAGIARVEPTMTSYSAV